MEKQDGVIYTSDKSDVTPTQTPVSVFWLDFYHTTTEYKFISIYATLEPTKLPLCSLKDNKE